MQIRTTLTVLALSVMLAACNDNNSSSSTPTGSGSSTYPIRVASLSAAEFQGQLMASASGTALKNIPGNTPVCGFDVHYMQYGTVGGAGEKTSATGAMLIPTGTSTACTGPRPIVLYAHGTTISKNYNLADVTDPNNPASGEFALIATFFAAQGYIVVAPNYAGYDKSPLPYHPYLNAQQQSQEMIDILAAARANLPKTPAGASVSDSGKLFVTGYSQGGHVAMATLQALQAKGMTVTAGAPMSGPYSMALFGDAIFGGNVNVGGTLFAPLLAASYQNSYGNVYGSITDIYNPIYATGLDTLLPGSLSTDQLFSMNKVPQSALFQANPPAPYASLDPISPASPSFAFGFDSTNYLIQTGYRAAYLGDASANPDQVTANTGYFAAATPANNLRKDLKANDLRTYKPTMPVLMCGGNADPTVFFQPNTQVMYGAMTVQGTTTFAMVDVAAASNALTTTTLTSGQQSGMAVPVGTAQAVFSGGQTQVYSGTYNAVYSADIAAGMSTENATADATGQATVAVAKAYHGSLVPPACMVAARGFFQQF